ncbi:MAG: LD-carboxypeptidase [Planctomycetota bacterium]
MLIPPPLSPGDAVAFIAPAGPFDPPPIERATAAFEARGYRIKTYGDLYRRHGYLAGTDQQRLDELNAAVRDPDTRAILPARGGYGCGRLLDDIDYAAAAADPKRWIGFSDVTALHTALWAKCRLVTFHGPHPKDGLGREDGLPPAAEAAYWRALEAAPEGNLLPPDLVDSTTTRTPGVAEGQLFGGNVAVLASLLGTPYAVDTTDAILLLEDVGERPYRIDRFLLQLRQTGKLDSVRGIVLGYFTDCGPEEDEDSLSLEQVLADYIDPLGVPVLQGFPAGHESPNLALPLGVPVRLDADSRSLTALPAAPPA